MGRSSKWWWRLHPGKGRTTQQPNTHWSMIFSWKPRRCWTASLFRLFFFRKAKAKGQTKVDKHGSGSFLLVATILGSDDIVLSFWWGVVPWKIQQHLQAWHWTSNTTSIQHSTKQSKSHQTYPPVGSMELVYSPTCTTKNITLLNVGKYTIRQSHGNPIYPCTNPISPWPHWAKHPRWAKR